MRPWIGMLMLGAGLTAATALPAAANDATPRSEIGLDKHVRMSPLRHGFVHRGTVFGPFVWGVPGGYFEGGMPPIMLLSSAPPEAPQPRHDAAEEQASVETSPEGVVIVRGPGSRHLGY